MSGVTTATEQLLMSAQPDRSSAARPIRVVVCDDSPFMRRMLRQGLERAHDIEVVASAANAREAIELVKTLWPDVLTLDLELPDLDGVRVLQELRDLPVRVLVVSAFTDNAGTERAVEALAEGAIDVLGKPNLDAAPSVFIAQLLDNVREVAGGAPYVPACAVRVPAGHVTNQRLFVIGASTGGPRALQTLLASIPKDFGAPILVVQHMPPNFNAPFARRLDRTCEIDVVEAEHGAPLRPGRAYVARAGHHLHVEGMLIRVRAGHRVNGLIPSVDVTMIDAAASWGSAVTGVVLTGIGRDGREGARAIRSAGGRVLVEHERTCAVYGMPRAIVEAELADEIVPLDELAGMIVREVHA